MSLNKDSTFAPHLALFFVQLMFGTAPVFGKFALQTFSPYSIVGFRVGGAALAFYFLQRFRGSLALEDRRDYLKFAGFAVFGIILNQLLFFKGLSLTTATNTSLIAVTIPIFTIIISTLLGNDFLSWRKVLGISVAAFGVSVLINPLKADFSATTFFGDLLVLLNSLSYAFYVALSKKLISKHGALKSIAWIFIFGSIVNVPLGAYFLQQVELTQVSWFSWLMVGCLVLFPTILAYYWNTWALSKVEPSVVVIYVYLQPLIGFLSAVIFLGETLSFRPVMSGLLIFIGVFLVTRVSGSSSWRRH
jgi:drug/metabolite transporter (DMT)-like permease